MKGCDWLVYIFERKKKMKVSGRNLYHCIFFQCDSTGNSFGGVIGGVNLAKRLWVVTIR